ncbi:NPQTN class sortase B protein-sorting domain-containing protein [Mammaliicoccus lentus]|nr:NPQTN class sortase B protein-sorting domain-containing protein [Mammaliicoccus lentus]MBW0771301.1 NPQTN class sortase B protein-sorting domain-containing protein [Mammaliicoccus lentus]
MKNPQTSAGTPAVIFTLPIFAGLILVVTFVFSRKMKRGHN